jgi:dTMP kinase
MKILNNNHILISFEGIDGCGKSTVIEKIKNHYKKCQSKYNVYVYYAPGSFFGNIAKRGKEYNINSEKSIYLFWLERQLEIQNWYNFKEPTLILADRYVDSTYVYGNLARSIDLINHNYDPDFYPYADLNILLDVSAQKSLYRIDKNRKEKDDNKLDIQETKDIMILENRIKLFKNIYTKDFVFTDFFRFCELMEKRNNIIIDTNHQNLEQVTTDCINNINKILATGKLN